jgi:hypothetical protein
MEQQIMESCVVDMPRFYYYYYYIVFIYLQDFILGLFAEIKNQPYLKEKS